MRDSIILWQKTQNNKLNSLRPKQISYGEGGGAVRGRVGLASIVCRSFPLVKLFKSFQTGKYNLQNHIATNIRKKHISCNMSWTS